MSIDELILEKEKQYGCEFGEEQIKALKDIAITYAGFFDNQDKNDKGMFIIRCVGHYFCLPDDWYKDSSKKGDIITARQISMYFMKEFTKLKLREVAGFFKKLHSEDKKKHDNAVFSINKVLQYRDTDKAYREKLEELEYIIKTKIYMKPKEKQD